LLLFSTFDNLEEAVDEVTEATVATDDNDAAVEAEVLLLLFSVTDDSVDMMAKTIHLSICTVCELPQRISL